MDHYAARVCWNTKGWVSPSGDAVRLEQDTYVTRVGFGHEEWLFNFQWILDGWKYAFLQPVNKALSRFEGGETLDVRLYTIADRKAWFYVGRVQPCEVLSERLARDARAAFRKNGWLGQMLAQVREVGGKEKGLKYSDPRMLFNVRFRPEDAEILDPMKPVGSKDAIRRARRYGLVSLEGKLARAVEEWPQRRGTTQRGQVGKVSKRAVAATEMNLAHVQLQHELFEVLARRYGKGAVIKEEDFADLKVRHDGKLTIVEVKTDPSPMRAVREAVGQLLEYATAARSGAKSRRPWSLRHRARRGTTCGSTSSTSDRSAACRSCTCAFAAV
jgi:hypothetical protein